MIYLFSALALFIILISLREYFTAKNKKRYLIQISIELPLIIVLLFLFGPFFVLSPIKIGYSTLKENNLTLYYPGKSIDLAKDTMTQLRKADEMNRQFYKSIPAPNWFNEGLASYIGKMDEYRKPNELQVDLRDGRYLKDILKMRGFLGTAMWLKKISIDKASGVLYGQTYLMVKYLFDKYGQEKMYDFVVSLKNQDFEKAFVQSFGLTEEQFFQEFTDYIQNYQLEPQVPLLNHQPIKYP